MVVIAVHHYVKEYTGASQDFNVQNVGNMQEVELTRLSVDNNQLDKFAKLEIANRLGNDKLANELWANINAEASTEGYHLVKDKSRYTLLLVKNVNIETQDKASIACDIFSFIILEIMTL